MNIEIHKVKQFCSINKNIVCVDNKPICICGSKTSSLVSSYLQGYDVKINDGKIKKVLDKIIKDSKEG